MNAMDVEEEDTGSQSAQLRTRSSKAAKERLEREIGKEAAERAGAKAAKEKARAKDGAKEKVVVCMN